MNEQTIFIDAMQLAGSELDEYLTDQCKGDVALRKRVESLLALQEKASGFLSAPAVKLDDTHNDSREFESEGTCIGPYKLLEVIGEGGMGTVYMAEQTEPVKRRVALKVIKIGMDTRQVIARFEAERQALAVMDHANIAKVLDAGATDAGRPYFVMELVKGTSITKFCDEQQLDTESRLKLFQQVCRAVQHAHQKGVIHRDLKPANIMVAMYDDQPVPKIIDFGVAKATEEQLTEKTMFTRFGQIVGTLPYMSPEQAQFNQKDIDTRSDIYSLGAVLYELLSGQPPFDQEQLKSQALDETLRMIREDEPTKPSTKLSGAVQAVSIASSRKSSTEKLGSILRGDLDWIVMKAIEKDRSRRYETANGFALDLDRYLNHEPVSAIPPTTAYRLRKFARRNKGSLFAGAILGATIIVSFTLASVLIWKESQRRKYALIEKQAALETAQQATDKLSALFDFVLREIVESAQPGPPHYGFRNITVREAILKSNEKVEQAFADLSLRASVKHNLGVFLSAIGEYEKARDNFESASALWSQTGEDAKFEITDNTANLVEVYWKLGETELAISTARNVFAFFTDNCGNVDPKTIRALRQLGVALWVSGQYDSAAEALQQVVNLADGAELERLHALAQLNLGNCKFSQQEYDSAELSWMNAMGEFEILDDKLNVAIVQANLSMVYWETDRQDESISMGERAAKTTEEILGPTHPQSLSMCREVAEKKFQSGDWGDAAVDFRKILEATRQRYGDDHEKTALAMGALGVALRAEGQLDEALTLQKDSLHVLRSIYDDRHPSVLEILANLGLTYMDMREAEAAAKCYQDVIDARLEILSQEPENWSNALSIGGTYCNLGILLSKKEKKHDEAIKAFTKGIAILEKLNRNYPTAVAKRFLVNSYVARSEAYGALDRIEEALADTDNAISNSTTDGRRDAMRLYKARLLAQSGDYLAAVKVIDDVLTRTNDADMYYLSAEIVAVAVLVVSDANELNASDRNELLTQYEAKAVDLLGKAVDEGYFNIETRVGEFVDESAFDILSDAPGFESLSKQIRSRQSVEENKNGME